MFMAVSRSATRFHCVFLGSKIPHSSTEFTSRATRSDQGYNAMSLGHETAALQDSCQADDRNGSFSTKVTAVNVLRTTGMA
jgi:hypothetical protein